MIHGLPDRLVSRLLSEVTRPGRYAGDEINLTLKHDAGLRFLLCFPDLYEIGMSNVGLRVVHHVLNRHPDLFCDLAFAPWVDMESFMRARGIGLAGLASGTRAKDFDILGFSLQHELQYTNVINMLDLAGVGLVSDERTDDAPIVVAGGPCAFNPEPMSGFVDAFAIGDGESLALDIATAVLKAKNRGLARSKAIEMLAGIEGVYVPSVHRGDSGVSTVLRRTEPVLKEGDFPLPPVVPLCPITHDRLTVEIMRGCTRGCRFCSAGMLTRPVRQRTVDSVVRLVEAGIGASGWEEVSLVSLSSSDYYDLPGLVSRLTTSLGPRRVSISLPSMRPGTFSDEIADMIRATKKTGLTFAPEAGSDRLRRAINKGIDEDELYGTVETAFGHGWDSVKLYFMIGLPGETDDDIGELVRMVRSVESICRVYGRRKRVTVSISPFVPRPHTPFQWEEQTEPEAMLRRISRVRKGLPDRRVKIKWRDPYMARLEGLLARADRSLGTSILAAWKAGSRFESWTDRFDFGLWQRIFEEQGVGISGSPGGLRPGDPMPWDHIAGGVTRDFLMGELDRAGRGELTPDCRLGDCSHCGACPGPESMEKHRKLGGDGEGRPQPGGAPVSAPDIRIRYRVRYLKGEPMRFTSHLDTTRCIQRGLRRAEVPVCFSSGFSPHPRVSLGPPLPLGVLGESEFFDVFLSRSPSRDWLSRLSSAMPEGMKMLEAKMIPLHSPSLMKSIGAAEYQVVIWCHRAADGDHAVEALRGALSAGCRIFSINHRHKDGKIVLTVVAGFVQGSPRPEKVFRQVLADEGLDYGILRKRLFIVRNGILCSPLSADSDT